MNLPCKSLDNFKDFPVALAFAFAEVGGGEGEREWVREYGVGSGTGTGFRVHYVCSAFAYFTNTAYAASMNARENLFKLAKKCNKNGERMRERGTKGGGGEVDA